MYDIILIGAGGAAGGIFAAYELVKDDTNLKVLMIEKGFPLSKRFCPKTKKSQYCMQV